MSIRNLTRFRLRTLFILMAAAAVLTGSIRRVVDQYHVEQAALRELNDSRFPLTVKLKRPWWVPGAIDARLTRVFDRVVILSIAGQSMDWDRGRSLSAQNFRDEDVQLLTQFRSLKCLDLSTTQIGPKSLEELARLRSLKFLDISGTAVGMAAISEFRKRRPNCLICESQAHIIIMLHADGTFTVGHQRQSFHYAEPLLTNARRGPDAFECVPMLYIVPDNDFLGPKRAKMIRTVQGAAADAGYRSVQVAGDGI